jgi:hypothetical protein
MNPITTLVGDEQCMRALQRANEVRVARAALKRRVTEGEVNAAEVILSCASEIEGMAVGELLISQRGWGQSRSRRLLTAVPLSERKTLGTMTDRQRRALAALLAAA